MVAKWVKTYDPRLDSTYPGGSGSHRWDDESTWAWSENPGLHALAYARGRFMGPNNVKVVGAGIPKQFIDIPAFVELANVCDANGWTCGGAVYEGPGSSRWDNLKTILASAAAKPAWVGGMLTCEIAAPKVALATITADDLADGDIEVQAMSSASRIGTTPSFLAIGLRLTAGNMSRPKRSRSRPISPRTGRPRATRFSTISVSVI
jgi:hypothetical protein